MTSSAPQAWRGAALNAERMWRSARAHASILKKSAVGFFTGCFYVKLLFYCVVCHARRQSISLWLLPFDYEARKGVLTFCRDKFLFPIAPHCGRRFPQFVCSSRSALFIEFGLLAAIDSNALSGHKSSFVPVASTDSDSLEGSSYQLTGVKIYNLCDKQKEWAAIYATHSYGLSLRPKP